MPNAVEVVIKALDQTKGGIQSAVRNLDAMKGSAAAVVGAVLALGATVGVAVFEMAKSFAESADEIGKLSQKTGIATETLTQLKFVAEDNSVSWESLQKSLRKAAEEAVKTGQNFEQLLITSADRFAATADGAGKAAEAQRIFGKSGMDLIPILDLGSQKLKEALDEAKEYTTAIDSQTSVTGDAFGDNVDRIGRLFTKVFTDGIKEALPYLYSLTQSMLDITKAFFGSGSAMETYFIPAIKSVGKGLALTGAAAVNLKDLIQGLSETIFRFFDGGEAAMDESFAAMQSKMMENGKKMMEIWNDTVEQPKVPGSDAGKPQLFDPEQLRKAADIESKIVADSLTGADALRAKIHDHYERTREEIENLKIENDEKSRIEGLALELQTQKEQEARLKGHYFKENLRELEEQGNFKGIETLLQTESAANALRLEQNQQFISLYVQQWKQAHATIKSFATELFGSFSQNFGNAIGSILRDFNHAGDAVKKFGQAMLTTITNFVGQWIASRLTMLAMSAIFGQQAVAQTAPAALQMGALWSTPAIMASIASFGAADSIGLAALTSSVAASHALAMLGGVAHGGLDFVPQESTYLLQRGEAVLQPAANVALMDFLKNQSTGTSGASMVEVHIDGEVLGRGIGRISRDGRLVISARSVV